MIINKLIPSLREQFRLDWRGIHGVSHWARVRRNGLLLAESTGASTAVVELFAFLHDSCRRNDGHDPEHGARAAVFAKSLQGFVFTLSSRELAALVEACQGHTHGRTSDNVTVQTCWDADRLDLGRVGIRPRPERLCTDTARQPEIIEWAYMRSLPGYRGIYR
ncbi:MAG: hypothetical protein WBN57_08770 [Gammaproteobacteria bacterium]